MMYAELFAGAGGLSMGLEAAGFHCAAHAEIEPHARAVLVLAVGHLVAPLLTCSAGCAYHEQEMGR